MREGTKVCSFCYCWSSCLLLHDLLTFVYLTDIVTIVLAVSLSHFLLHIHNTAIGHAHCLDAVVHGNRIPLNNDTMYQCVTVSMCHCINVPLISNRHSITLQWLHVEFTVNCMWYNYHLLVTAPAPSHPYSTWVTYTVCGLWTSQDSSCQQANFEKVTCNYIMLQCLTRTLHNDAISLPKEQDWVWSILLQHLQHRGLHVPVVSLTGVVQNTGLSTVGRRCEQQ